MHTDKPVHISVKEYIIRRIAPNMRISEDVIAAVVSHQYSSGNAATKQHNEVEFSGLGKFMLSKKKALKKLEMLTYLNINIENLKLEHPEKENNYNKKITENNFLIEYIKTKC